MKKLILSIILLFIFPTYLNAMLAATPEELYKMYESIPLHPLEEQLIRYEISKRGTDSVRSQLDNLPFPIFTIEAIFHKDEGIKNPLVKNIFDAIEVMKNKPKDSLIPARYLSLLTSYTYLKDPLYISVKTNFYNLEAVRAILSECTQKN